ncbi:MAG: rod shape-determining protein RodA [Candidatus Omnitrophica bacterium]|nr:rod shape-determining protein RodA [Candidatus Omnitrophota bacterium]
MRRINFSLLGLTLAITAIGISCIYSSVYQNEGRLWQAICERQILWVGMGLVLFFSFAAFNYRRLWDATVILYVLVLLLLLFVFVSGVVRLGAQRWLKIAWFNFQPSEVAKLAMAIFLARYYSKKPSDSIALAVNKLDALHGFILPLIFVAMPTGLVIEQPDLGSGLIIFFIFIAITLIAGVRLRYVMIFLAAGFSMSPLLWHFLKDYQRDRLMVFLNPNIDPLGAGYTVIQAKIAIGSGWLFGKGWLGGTQSQLHFLPESHTDFIFSTFAEEWGFLGSCVLLVLYYMLVRKGLSIGMRSHDYFGKLLAFGISLMLGIQICVNIAMNLGLAPVVGIPLPLMSYGGSSIIVTFSALGILASIERRT